jgi:putative flavoprotein involved in K+ transport
MSRGSNGRPARDIDVAVIGAGHAGLASSYCLAESAIDHVVLERGEIANSWRHERWDSLTLLTPNWQCKVPGHVYSGDDPDGFLAVPQLIDFIDEYAAGTSAPVETNTDVPAVAEAVPADIETITPHQYRNPQQLEPGGVLVVGASATGLQLAEEIQQSGRPVTIAVGEHVRMPRIYRGRDILWWLDRVGISDERYDEIDDVVRARHLPSPQLVGTPQKYTLDLNAMTSKGVTLVGRLMGFNNDVAQFSGSLKNVCALADLKMNRMLNTIDEWVEDNDDASSFDPPHRSDSTRVDESPPLTLNLKKENIHTILWATGFRPDYSWLEVDVLDRKGMIRHDGGIVESPGMYVIGLPCLRRRKSSFIHGVEDDARDLNAHLVNYLHQTAASRA